MNLMNNGVGTADAPFTTGKRRAGNLETWLRQIKLEAPRRTPAKALQNHNDFLETKL